MFAVCCLFVGCCLLVAICLCLLFDDGCLLFDVVVCNVLCFV